jgi:hypothetical protein
VEAPANRRIDPASPLVLVCLFCDNIFFGKRGEVFPVMEQIPTVNRECPLCKDIPLQILGLHPGAWSGTKVDDSKVPQPGS